MTTPDASDAATPIDAEDASDDGYTVLFDGTDTSNWVMAGQGNFVVLNGALDALPGNDLGLYWNTVATPPNFSLKLEWLRTNASDNSGIFLRFPDPNSKGYDNTAYVGVDFGFEIQIDDNGYPDGANQHKTGAIYDQPNQAFALEPSLPPGQWNTYEIHCVDQTYTVFLNGVQVTQFIYDGSDPHPGRGLPTSDGDPRYIGLQTHTGLVSFRNVKIKAL
jgi:hypothetical protein